MPTTKSSDAKRWSSKGVSTRSILSRRQALGLLSLIVCIAIVRPVSAQITDWSEADRQRFLAFRQAFSEYGDLSDVEFARRMESLFRTLDSNPDADAVVAEVSRRLPEYQEVPRRRMQREMVSLFRKAKQHFEG